MQPPQGYKKYLPVVLLALAAWASITIFLISLVPPHERTAAGLERSLAAVLVGQQEPQEEPLHVLLAVHQGPFVATAPSKTSGCLLRGPLPDAGCTPGGVFANAATSTICVPGYTKGVRSVSTKLRKQLYAAYGISYPVPTGTYELDHLIPLAIGGDNSAANLFPEAAEPKPGFKEKDVVEVYLQEQVCAGKVALGAAQAQVASDWLAVYKLIDRAEVTRIRQKYTSWAN